MDRNSVVAALPRAFTGQLIRKGDPCDPVSVQGRETNWSFVD
jgi:hypothetical protein